MEPIARKLTAKPDYATLAALALCACFSLSAFIFIPYVGVQNDEALFAAGIYQPAGSEHGIPLFGHKVATMLMSYLGALKTWLYLPIFRVWPPSVYSLRVPVVLIGAVTIWIFFALARRLLGPLPAVAAAALLATDATYLMTTTFDWGPVALQHLLAVGGVLGAVRFHETGRALFLTLAFWCFGLGMWDKALFAWTVAGLVVAALFTVRGQMLRHVSRRNIAIAAVAFCLGAAPLIRHNVAFGFPTLRQNVRFSTDGVSNKLAVLRTSLDGTSLLGYIVADRTAEPPGEPRTHLERASVAVASVTSANWGRSARLGAVVAAILLLPFAGRTRRVGLFALIFSAVTWLAMAFTKGAGTGAHHAVLIWPFPQLLVAAVFTCVLERLRRGTILYAAIVGALCLAGAAVVNHHFAMLVRGGVAPLWTDAIFPLSDYVAESRRRTVYATDWGFADSLRMLNRGQVDVVPGWRAFDEQAGADDRRRLLDRIAADKHAILIRHAPDNVVLRNAHAAFDAALASAGYAAEPLKIICDRFGRPQFEIFGIGAGATSGTASGTPRRP